MSKIARVRFNDVIGTTDLHSSAYHFFTDIEDLVKNDFVVVDTVNGMKVAQFVDYIPNSKKAGKYIVCKIDTTDYVARIESQRRLAEIKAKMEARRKQLEEIEIFALLAREDDSMKELFDEYMQLNS